jgi:hypothetical protein
VVARLDGWCAGKSKARNKEETLPLGAPHGSCAAIAAKRGLRDLFLVFFYIEMVPWVNFVWWPWIFCYHFLNSSLGAPICSGGDNPPLCSGHGAPAGVLIEPGSYIEEKVMIRKSWVIAIVGLLFSVSLLGERAVATGAENRKKIVMVLDSTDLLLLKLLLQGSGIKVVH